MTTHEEILTIPEVAALLKIAEKTVYVLAQRGDLPGFKVGGQWRFSRAAISKWIEGQSQSARGASDSKRGGEAMMRDALLERDPVLGEIVKRLTRALEPARIYLFGSRARGEGGPDSDYDILVLVERPTEPRYRLSQKGFRALRGLPAAVDVVVWDRATFDARAHLRASFAATVKREGRLLHGA